MTSKPFKGLSNNTLKRKRYVFDCHITGECWALEPVMVKCIGYIDVYNKVIKTISYSPILPVGITIDDLPEHYTDNGIMRTYVRKFNYHPITENTDE